MKKVLAMLLATSMILTLASCGEKKKSDSKESKSKQISTELQTTEPTEAPESSEDTDDDNSDDAEVKHNVPDELFAKEQQDLLCRKNYLFSALYVGKDEDKNEDKDGLFFDFYDEDALYYVRTGFNEDDGVLNFIWGYSRLYHFYDDADSYNAALAEVPDYDLKEKNDECLYFTTACRDDPNAESYADLIESFANQETDGGIFNNFMPYIE